MNVYVGFPWFSFQRWMSRSGTEVSVHRLYLFGKWTPLTFVLIDIDSVFQK